MATNNIVDFSKFAKPAVLDMHNDQLFHLRSKLDPGKPLCGKTPELNVDLGHLIAWRDQLLDDDQIKRITCVACYARGRMRLASPIPGLGNALINYRQQKLARAESDANFRLLIESAREMRRLLSNIDAVATIRVTQALGSILAGGH